jgi:hypothetical protein
MRNRKQLTFPTFEQAWRDMPTCVDTDPLTMKTINDLRSAVLTQLDLIEEAQDGTEKHDLKAVKRWLKEYLEPPGVKNGVIVGDEYWLWVDEQRRLHCHPDECPCLEVRRGEIPMPSPVPICERYLSPRGPQSLNGVNKWASCEQEIWP